jgi:hypothetical protein
MPLSVGTKLGLYEILAPIGAGGWAEAPPGTFLGPVEWFASLR